LEADRKKIGKSTEGGLLRWLKRAATRTFFDLSANGGRKARRWKGLKAAVPGHADGHELQIQTMSSDSWGEAPGRERRDENPPIAGDVQLATI